MEKRLVAFLVVSTGILLSYSAIQQVFFKPPEKKPAVAGGEGQNPLDADPENQDPGDKDPGDKDPGDKDPGDKDPVDKDPGDKDPGDGQQIPAAYYSMGRFDGSAGPLQVYFSNRGATVVRVELVEREEDGELRYRDLTEKSGYLGFLALQNEPRGLRVQVVGAGTPADLAGIEVGDLILRVGDRPADPELGIRELLRGTEPGGTLTLQVERASGVKTLTATLTDRALPLIQPERLVSGVLAGHPGSFRVSLQSLSAGEEQVFAPTKIDEEIEGMPSLWNNNWQAEVTENEIAFSFPISAAAMDEVGVPGELTVVKRFRLSDVSDEDHRHHFTMSVDVENTGDSQLSYSLRIDGPNGLPTEGWWYLNKIHPSWGGAGARDVVWKSDRLGHNLRSATQIWKQARKDKSPTQALFTEQDGQDHRLTHYIGLDTQYFTVGIANDEPLMFNRATPYLFNPHETLKKKLVRTGNISFRLEPPSHTLKAGAKETSDYRVFAGPKRSDVLDAYNMGECIEYGWFPWVAKPLGALLHMFEYVVRNYGLAIICLTIVVRGCMFPISRKAAKNAQMMQELAPEMKAITEKHKNAPDKRMAAQQELYKKHNFNPFGGCLLMFVQLPIFIGLYRCLSVDVELRQASLIPGINWCSNLAGPDMFWEWGIGAWPMFTDYAGWLGPYFNILPIVTVVLFLVQQKMFTPPATDEQTAMQQKMMKYMMLFIGVLFYKVASGLCIYFIASSLWGITERKLFLPKTQLKKDGGAEPKGAKKPEKSPPSKPSGKPGRNGSGGAKRRQRRKAK